MERIARARIERPHEAVEQELVGLARLALAPCIGRHRIQAEGKALGAAPGPVPHEEFEDKGKPRCRTQQRPTHCCRWRQLEFDHEEVEEGLAVILRERLYLERMNAE